jgi:YjbE family integral membrane protein
VLRIFFALITTWLLGFGGALLIAGGLLLLWVTWKMWRELRTGHEVQEQAADGGARGRRPQCRRHRRRGRAAQDLRQAATQILVADVSMSLDNVLAGRGAAREHPGILVFGLVLSVALMGLASTFIARLIGKYRWIAYVGVAIILLCRHQDDVGRLQGARTTSRRSPRPSVEARGRDPRPDPRPRGAGQ